MFNELTIQQLCALDYNRNMVVTSGPGAGKTRILSHRFCFILLTDKNVSLPQILTLTFTEKAAEEMKSRIYNMLIEIEREQKNKGSDEILRKVKGAKDQFYNNNISTIHSFCANLLREHPVEAGTDPGFTIIQGVRQKELMDKSVGSAIASIWKNEKEILIPLLRSFGGSRGLANAVRSLMSSSYTFQRVRKTADNLFKVKDWEKQVFEEYCKNIRDEQIIPYLRGLREMDETGEDHRLLMERLEEWETSQEDTEYWGIPGLFRDMRLMADNREKRSLRLKVDLGLKSLSYADMINEYYPDLFIHDNPDSIYRKEFEYFLKGVEASLMEYRREKERINCLDFSDLEARSYEFLKGLVLNNNLQSLKKIRNRYKYIMVDEFQDTNRIQWEIIRLLCLDMENTGQDSLISGKIFVVGDKRQAIYRFRGGDVTVFEEVNREIKDSNSRKSPPLFWQRKEMTGPISLFDPSFDADEQDKRFSRLSPAEREKIISGDIYLPHNFRSDENDILFFNRTFNEIFSNKDAGSIRSYETAPRDIFLPEDSMERKNCGTVSIYVSPGNRDKNKQVENEASLISNIIEGILGRHGNEKYEYITYPDIREKLEKNEQAIGILFFTFSHIKVYENILRESGIPFMIHRGKGFYRCREVIEMVQLLNYLIDRRQEISLLSVLRGEIFGLTDPEIFDLFYGERDICPEFDKSENPAVKKIGNQLRIWRSLSNRLTVAELIRTIISHRSLTAVYSAQPNGRQVMMNIEKLIDIARTFQTEDNGALYEFIQYCMDMADQDEEEGEAVVDPGEGSPVSLMTIHAAKGLEFPMVILPQLDRKILWGNESGRIVRLYQSQNNLESAWNHTEGEIPVWPVEIPALKFEKNYSPLGNLLIRRNRLEDMAENRRVFYVGCTRAKNHLILTGSGSKRTEDNGRGFLTSDDYRERATILEILHDIYDIANPVNEESDGDKTQYYPVIKKSDTEAERFKGIDYRKGFPDRDSLGIYDDSVERLDLTSPLVSHPYYQLSFTSVQVFKKCPVRFYYDVVLRLRESQLYSFESDESSLKKSVLKEENEYEYSSEDALLIGNFIHRYLEIHEFGKPLDVGFLNGLWGEIDKSGNEPCYCREKIIALLGNAVNDKKLVDLLSNTRSHSEKPFLISVPQGVEFIGVVDRLFKDKRTGLWTIIDWKSNSLKGKDPETLIKENHYDMQLGFYKWAVEHILNEKVGKQYIYFLDESRLLECDWKGDPEEEIREIIARSNDYEENRQLLKNEIDKIRETGDSQCRFCGYGNIICI